MTHLLHVLIWSNRTKINSNLLNENKSNIKAKIENEKCDLVKFFFLRETQFLLKKEKMSRQGTRGSLEDSQQKHQNKENIKTS